MLIFPGKACFSQKCEDRWVRVDVRLGVGVLMDGDVGAFIGREMEGDAAVMCAT
jgi:hypothetical protein